MNLYIESYVLDVEKERNEYFNIMKQISAKMFDESFDINSPCYVHEIKFDKDLKFSELMKVKEIIFNIYDAKSAWIKDDNQNELVLFGKD